MKPHILLAGFALVFAGCSTTKITSTPHAGYRMHEQIAVTPLAELSEVENDDLMRQAHVLFAEELIFLKIMPYQDALYKARQIGVTLPEFNRYDTASFDALLNTVKLNYILTGEVVRIYPRSDDQNSPHYAQPQAILSFQLIDTRHRTIAWRCTVKFTANPVGFGKNPESKINVRNEDDAVHAAYRKAMKRFTKEFALIPNRPSH